MSRIRSKDTKPELLVRKFLFSNGFRYRLHDRKLSGTPDIVLPKYKTVININGCFWHGHEDCRFYKVPKTRTEWWLNKINNNRDKDHRNKAKLLSERWNVITIFECELKSSEFGNTMKNLVDILKKGFW